VAHKIGAFSLEKFLRDMPLYGWGGSPTRLTPAFIELCRERLKESGFSVNVRAGGAHVGHPVHAFEVEIVFDGDARTIGELADTIDQVTITGEIPSPLDLNPYINALALKLISEPAASSDQLPTGRPEAGRPANKIFYRDLVALANRLSIEGDSQPAATIAEWMSTDEEEVWPDQVRTWLHRGRAYLREGD
jgi:hypothetical protein